MGELDALENGLRAAETALLEELRDIRRGIRSLFDNGTLQPNELTAGQRIADKVASTMGSWKFIIIQSIILVFWIILNVVAWFKWHWDVYPFVFLNLMLSFQAAYAAPFIMMSQNRQSDVDRQAAATDHQVNVKAELEVEMLHRKIDAMRETEIMYLSKAVHDLVLLLQKSGICEPEKGKNG
jgi:uncharacterized membrane protein